MKKLIMFAAMAVMALTASAQSQGDYRITPHAGIGYTNMSNVKALDENISSGIGYVLGVDAEYMLTNNFGVSAGVDFLYSESESVEISSKHEYVEATTGEYYLNTAYLNIPVLAQYHFGKFAVKAGVQPGFNLSAKFHEGVHGKEDVKDDINSFSLAVPVGVSYDFNIPLTLEARVAIPVTNQNKKDEYFNYKQKDSKFLTAMVTLGWRF